jgi:hypothetical protein
MTENVERERRIMVGLLYEEIMVWSYIGAALERLFESPPCRARKVALKETAIRGVRPA